MEWLNLRGQRNSKRKCTGTTGQPAAPAAWIEEKERLAWWLNNDALSIYISPSDVEILELTNTITKGYGLTN